MTLILPDYIINHILSYRTVHPVAECFHDMFKHHKLEYKNYWTDVYNKEYPNTFARFYFSLRYYSKMINDSKNKSGLLSEVKRHLPEFFIVMNQLVVYKEKKRRWCTKKY
jgi:hypothetical protein